MTQHTAISVSLCNLSMQLHSDISEAIQMLNKCGHLFQLCVDTTKSHLIVVDIDDETGQKQLNQSLPGQVKLVVSNESVTGRNIVSINKPVTVENIKTLLSKLHNMMQAHLLKIGTSISPSAFKSRIQETIFFDLLEAKNNKQFIHIVSDNIEIFVDGNNQSLKSDNSLDDIRMLFTFPYEKISVKKINDVFFYDETSELHLHTLHNILWTSAIICSSGQILPGHDDKKAVKLRAWPSFTRNDFKPEHLKIAAILAQRHISLAELATQSNISYSEIINFYNAAYAVDLIDQNPPAANSSEVYTTRPNSKPVKSNLLNKIAARLGFNHRFNGTYHG